MKQTKPFNLSATTSNAKMRSLTRGRALLMWLALAWVLLQTLGFMHRAQHTLDHPAAASAQVSILMPDHAAGSPDCQLLDALCAADTASGAHITGLPAAQPTAFFLTPFVASATLSRYWHAPARAPPVLS